MTIQTIVVAFLITNVVAILMLAGMLFFAVRKGK